MEGDSIYISLQEATQYCGYTQEYLSLRARQGKLKAIKFGRNWVTKREWLKEYLNNDVKKFAPPPENLPVEEERKPMLPKIRPELKLRFGFLVILVFALLVNNLFFGKESFKNVFEDLDFQVAKSNENVEDFLVDGAQGFVNFLDQIKTGMSMTFKIVENASQLAREGAVISAGDSFGSISENLKEFGQWLARQTFAVGQKIVGVYTTANDFVEQKLGGFASQTFVVGQKIVHSVRNTISSVPDFVRSVISNGVQGYTVVNNFVKQKLGRLVHPVRNIVSRTSSFVKNVISNGVQKYFAANDFIEEKISQGYRAVTQFLTPQKIVEEKLIPKLAGEGVVIIPSTEKNEELKEKIKAAFSDEIIVEAKDETSGFIIPIFKKVEEQKYLYIIVPISYEQ